MRLHRATHGMYPAAGGGVPSIWAQLMSPTRVLPRRNATIRVVNLTLTGSIYDRNSYPHVMVVTSIRARALSGSGLCSA